MLGILESMGIKLPQTSKISTTDLEKRLEKAWDAAQGINAELLAKLNHPGKLPRWETKGNLEKDFARVSLEDVAAKYIHAGDTAGFHVTPDAGAAVALSAIRELQQLLVQAHLAGDRGMITYNETSTCCLSLIVSGSFFTKSSSPTMTTSRS